MAKRQKRKGYTVHKDKNGKKCIRYQLLGVSDGSVPHSIIEAIIKAEFPHTPRKLIKYSTDDQALYFGNDPP